MTAVPPLARAGIHCMPQARMWNKGATTRLRTGWARAKPSTKRHCSAADSSARGGEHGALGATGRPAGVEDHRQPLSAVRIGRGRGRPIGQPSVQHRRGPAVPDDELNLGRREPGIDRDGIAPASVAPRKARHQSAPFAAWDRHPVAGADPGGRSRRRRGLAPSQAGVTQPAPGTEVGDRLRPRAALRRAPDKRGQVRGEPGEPEARRASRSPRPPPSCPAGQDDRRGRWLSGCRLPARTRAVSHGHIVAGGASASFSTSSCPGQGALAGLVTRRSSVPLASRADACPGRFPCLRLP